MEDYKAIQLLRKNIFLMAYASGIGHIPSSLSIVELLYVLYSKGILRYNAQNPDWEDRDRMILSKGHGSMALYSILSMNGFFPEETLWSFCKPGSFLGSEPNTLEIPGVDASTGSLGHGLSIGAGMALAKKIDQKDCKVYVILGDGECQEGSIWEAAMCAAGLRLNNLIAILDWNHLQKMGFINDIMGYDSWKARWESFGWEVLETDGHDLKQIESVFRAPVTTEKPRLILADTIKGKGISFMEGNPAWHYRMANKKDLKKVMAELDITEEELLYAKSFYQYSI
ncbi:transketolase [Akkermansia muciniphila]|nr:transketolase [Akkermansia muciniphila]